MQAAPPYVFEVHIDQWSTLAGLGLTALGVGLAIWQLWRTKTAAVAAKDAANSLAEKMDKFDSLTACASALAVIEEIKRHQRNSAWRLLPDRYSELRRLLSQVRGLSQDLTADGQRTLQTAIGQIATMEDKIEKHLASSNGIPDVVRLNKTISQQADKVIEIVNIIRNQLRGNHDS